MSRFSALSHSNVFLPSSYLSMKLRLLRRRKNLLYLIIFFIFYKLFFSEWNTPAKPITLPHTVDRIINGSVIPRIIHQSWKTKKVTSYTQGYVESCMKLNRNYVYMFWDDESILNLVKERYPHMLSVFYYYDGYNGEISKADLSRVLIVHSFGGVYMDLDVECLVPLDKLLGNHKCVLPQEPWAHAIVDNRNGIPFVSNFFIASTANDMFLQKIIDEFPYSAISDDVVERTGPGLFTKVYHRTKFANRDILPYIPEENALSMVAINEKQLMEKCYDLSYMQAFANKRNIPSLKMLLKYCNNPNRFRTNGTRYASHHFIHTWIDKDKFIYSDTFDVEELASKIGITYLIPDSFV